MPPEVGAGTFWTEAVAHVNDGKALDDVLAAIDATAVDPENKFGSW